MGIKFATPYPGRQSSPLVASAYSRGYVGLRPTPKISAAREKNLSALEPRVPTPWKTLIIKFPPPRDGKGVKCPGYARGGDVEASI